MGPSLHPYRPAGLKSDTAPLQRLAPGPCHALPVHQAPRHIGTMTVKTTGRRARKRQGSTDMTTPSTPAGTPALANLDSLYSQIAAPLPPVQFTGVYTIPNFHNPAGVNLSLSRRHRLAELADLFNFVILEDDAYGELRFSGEHIAAIYTMATPGRVVRSATLSKILSAGMRVGYLLAPEPVIARLNAMKLDGGASPFTNRLAAGYYSQHGDAHIHQLIGIYRHKRDALVRGLEEGFAQGDFAPLLAWLRRNVHAEGRRHRLDALCRKVTGQPLSADPLMRHLEGKLLPIYGLA
ncbi:MAG: aminotransferase class I/II-fold pyridoxal phosphate-dependent enzyme [Proteobacteria bacterium]|nr:aminotransferase class I/II-fold pyridoxal phosphate-dependent enzyme [Pseudomonadota bacterium]